MMAPKPKPESAATRIKIAVVRVAPQDAFTGLKGAAFVEIGEWLFVSSLPLLLSFSPSELDGIGVYSFIRSHWRCIIHGLRFAG